MTTFRPARDQIQKEVFSEKDKGEPIGVFAAYSDVEEGEIVTNKIAQLHAKSGSIPKPEK